MSEAVDYLMRLPMEPKKLPHSPDVAKNATVGIAGGELLPDALSAASVPDDALLPRHVLAGLKEARRSVDAAFCKLAALSAAYRRKHLYRDKSGAMAQMYYVFSDYHAYAINALLFKSIRLRRF